MSPAPSEMALFSTTESVAEWPGPPHRTEQQTAPTSRRGAWSAQNKTFVSWLQIERGPFSHNQPAFCCEQNTHPNSTYRCAQWVTTHTGRIDRISSREHTCLKLDGSVLHIFVSQNFCHPRVMSLSLPHLTLTTSTSSLSPTSPFFPSTRFGTRSHNTHKTFGTRSIFSLRSSTAEWRINTNPISHRL